MQTSSVLTLTQCSNLYNGHKTRPRNLAVSFFCCTFAPDFEKNASSGDYRFELRITNYDNSGSAATSSPLYGGIEGGLNP